MKAYLVYVISEDEKSFQVFSREVADWDSGTQDDEPVFEVLPCFASLADTWFWVKEHGYTDDDVVVKEININEFV